MKFNPAKYLREVRQEVSKVTWPSKKETFTSAGIVIIVVTIAAIILIVLFYVGLNYTRKAKKVTANTLILSLLFIMIGFSSWMMLPIRANANTTINENNPSSARELLAYYEREQYGDANVFYDTYYSNTYNREQDAANPTKDDKPKYEKKDGKYVIVNVYKDVLPN